MATSTDRPHCMCLYAWEVGLGPAEGVDPYLIAYEHPLCEVHGPADKGYPPATPEEEETFPPDSVVPV